MISRITPLIRPLIARDVDEAHRAATPLELFFDLVAVIALASIAKDFHHALAENHAGSGLLFFFMAFMAVWWPWNLFTWFASAFDNDDPLYRVLIMMMMVGLMIIAADLPQFFGEQELTRIFAGYLVMRVALVILWLRVGRHNAAMRRTVTRYTIGQIMAQSYWAFLVFGFEGLSTLFYALFFLGFVFEILVPWYAESGQGATWHRRHIIERFGLLNIIVLGEILLGSAELLKAAFEQSLDLHLIYLSGCGMVIAFSMWWLYFAEEAKLRRADIHHTLLWTYGHILIFAGGIATGAALGASTDMHDQIMEHGMREGSDAVRWAVSLSIGIYVFGVWFVRDRFVCSKSQTWILVTIACLIGISPLSNQGPFLPPALLALGVFIRQWGRRSSKADREVKPTEADESP